MAFEYNPNDYTISPYGFVSSHGGSSMYGSPSNVNKEFFNQNQGYNWKDSTKFAYEQMAQREANAFNVAVMNYQNDYNSPLEQMKRYQKAGLNPYAEGAVSPQSSASAPGSGAARGTSSHAQQTAQRLQFAQNMVGQVFDIVSGLAGIQKQVQQMKYNEEAYPMMINRLRYQAGNENLRGFLQEIGINSATVGLAKSAYEAGIPLNFLPWFTHGPQVYGSSIGFNFDDLDKFNRFLNESPYAKAITELINLRRAQGGNIQADRALKKAVKALNETKQQSEDVKQKREAVETLLKEWELNAKDVTGWESLDKLIWQLLN